MNYETLKNLENVQIHRRERLNIVLRIVLSTQLSVVTEQKFGT